MNIIVIWINYQLTYIIFTGLLNGDTLLLLQDICVQCVFAGLEWSGMSQCSDNSKSDCSQKALYSPQCLLSTLRTARKLTQAKQSRTLLSNGKNLSQIDLSKGDNSGEKSTITILTIFV